MNCSCSSQFLATAPMLGYNANQTKMKNIYAIINQQIDILFAYIKSLIYKFITDQLWIQEMAVIIIKIQTEVFAIRCKERISNG